MLERGQLGLGGKDKKDDTYLPPLGEGGSAVREDGGEGMV